MPPEHLNVGCITSSSATKWNDDTNVCERYSLGAKVLSDPWAIRQRLFAGDPRMFCRDGQIICAYQEVLG